MEEDNYTQKSGYGTHLKGSAGRVMEIRAEKALPSGRGWSKVTARGVTLVTGIPDSGTKEPGSIQSVESRKATDSWLTPSPHCLCTGAGRAGGKGRGGAFLFPWL